MQEVLLHFCPIYLDFLFFKWTDVVFIRLCKGVVEEVFTTFITELRNTFTSTF